MRATVRVILAGFILLAIVSGAGPAFSARGGNGPSSPQIAAAIAELLDGPERLPLPLERIRPALRAHYVRDGGVIYWVGTGRMTPFIQRLADAEDDGLNSADYPVDPLIDLRDAISADDVETAALAELYYSAFFVTYAADLKIGRVTPGMIDPRLFRNRKAVDVLRILTDLKSQYHPAEFLDTFESHNPHYRALKKMLRLYRALAEENDWPQVPAGPNIAPGGSDPRLAKVRRLLAMSGDYQGGDLASSAYDPELVVAVKKFQTRHGLEAKGLIGKQTVLAMNVPPAERAQQIMLNMERWRWMPESLGDYHFMVNLAGFELQRVRGAQIVERMDVVVGAVATQTPEFSDELEYVEINPTWTVPYSIATKEMLPKLRANPYAYADDFVVFMNGKITPWGAIDWLAYGPGRFPFTFRQNPGPKNALGRVKFMLPNPHNIYLHDTPAKDKFLSVSRAFSHGCIRLSRPLDLAYTILGEEAGVARNRIDAMLAAGATARVPLPRRIPVHLVYATAFFGKNGIEFRPDVYGRDRKLYAALFGKPTS